MTTLTLAKLDEIEAAAAKATPGPWIPTIPPESKAQVFCVESVDKNYALADCFCFADEQDKANAFYIALCDPATVAALCRVVRATLAWYPKGVTPKAVRDALRDAGLIE